MSIYIYIPLPSLVADAGGALAARVASGADMSRLGADNDGSDHNYRQRIDNVYQIRADKKKELHGKFPLLLVSAVHVVRSSSWRFR